MFRVVPDQLRVSEGWVRCGQCDEVFDASAHLQPDALDVESGTDMVAPQAEGLQSAAETGEISPPFTGDSVEDSAAESIATAESVPVADDESLPESQSGKEGVLPTPAAGVWEPAPQDTFLEKSPHELSRFEEFNSVLSAAHAQALSDQALNTFSSDAAAAGPRYQQSETPVGASTDDLKPSFLRHPRKPSAQSRPMVRAALATACLLLCGLLLLQVAVQERDRLAAHVPAAKPALDSVCALVACEVAALRQIEAIVIDSSSFAKERSDAYRLNFTLKNTATVDVAVPALELTLTDMREEAVVRRVFSPQDLGLLQTRFPGGTELNASLPVGIKMGGRAERITGYRLLAFYP